MNANSRHIPGKAHAPGVKCIVAVPTGEATELMQAVRGRVVKIIEPLEIGYKCSGCGGRVSVFDYLEYALMDLLPIWFVESADGKGKLPHSCSPDLDCMPVPQKYLIPIGGDELLKDELVTTPIRELMPYGRDIQAPKPQKEHT